SAIFKDTALSSQRPDFNSFLKKGDERLKLLEQVDRLPDLQSDFTSSQYKVVFKKSKSLLSGLSPDISPQKLRELLDEMERLGRKGGNWSGDASEGMEALEGGQTDRALEAMQRALDKMRAMEESQRSGKGLRGGRASERGAGRREGYDKNRTGRAGQMPSRLLYLGVIGQDRKMMEDAITREQVPRDYHDQVRNYFQALDER